MYILQLIIIFGFFILFFLLFLDHILLRIKTQNMEFYIKELRRNIRSLEENHGKFVNGEKE